PRHANPSADRYKTRVMTKRPPGERGEGNRRARGEGSEARQGARPAVGPSDRAGDGDLGRTHLERRRLEAAPSRFVLGVRKGPPAVLLCPQGGEGPQPREKTGAGRRPHRRRG